METKTKVVRSFQLDRETEQRLEQLAQERERSWSGEARLAIAEHPAQNFRERPERGEA